jgi:hypothetical protein
MRVRLVVVVVAGEMLLMAEAKGGGHGGGHGGGGHGRRSPIPLYKRTTAAAASFHNNTSSHENTSFVSLWSDLNPLGYHNVPQVNETVSVLVDKETKTYQDGNVTSVGDHGRFIVAVDYDFGDGGAKENIHFNLQGQSNLFGWPFLVLRYFCFGVVDGMIVSTKDKHWHLILPLPRSY